MENQQPLVQILKPNPALQRQGQIHIAKLTRTLDASAFQPDRRRKVVANGKQPYAIARQDGQPMAFAGLW
jgi:hypothetical protein